MAEVYSPTQALPQILQNGAPHSDNNMVEGENEAEDIQPHPKKWKGKGREIIFSAASPHSDSLASPIPLSPSLSETSESAGLNGVASEHGALETNGSSSYPPASEDSIEERTIQENLRQWELQERARRKAARIHRKEQEGAQGETTIGTLVRRGSQLWGHGKKSSNSKSSRTSSVGSARLATTEEESTNAMESAMPESEDAGVVKGRSPYGITAPVELSEISSSSSTSTFAAGAQNNPKRHQSTSSVASDSSTVTVTPTTAQRDVVATSTASQQDPFADPEPSKSTQIVKSSSTTTTKSSEKSAETRPLMMKTAGQRGMARPERYPTPKPLGIMDMAPLEVDLEAEEERRQIELEERQGGAVQESGRWWTDYLCGCREGTDRGGDMQAGRTNPFE